MTAPTAINADLTTLRAALVAVQSDIKTAKGLADRTRAMALEVCVRDAIAQAERIARCDSTSARGAAALPRAIERYAAAAALPGRHWLAPAPKF